MIVASSQPRALPRVGTTRDHAAQVVWSLNRHGFVKSHRGRSGGVSLAAPAETIGLGRVLGAMQPDLIGRPAATSGPDFASFRDLPMQHGAFAAVMDAARDSFFATLDDYSIADLVLGLRQGRLACLDCQLKTIALDKSTRARKRQNS